MKVRIYHRLNIRLLDLGLGDAFVPSEDALLEAISQIYARELLELRSKIITIFPDAIIEREKLFRSEPMYLSLTLITSLEKHQVEPPLDQMKIDGQIADWEDTVQEKHPSLRWLLEQLPRTSMLPKDLAGSVFLRSIGPLYHYHLRVFPEEIPDLSLQGLTTSLGQSSFSQTENNGVVTLDFSLDLGESLLLWCFQGNETINENIVVATAMLRQMNHLIVEKEEGLRIRPLGRDRVSGGFSTSP